MSKPKTAISPTRAENYPDWYQEVVRAADMAEPAPDVRGCMVIKPWGYALWENMQRELDDRFKATGHENAYFPLFIPLSYLQKEADHVEGFAKEMAVVTHHRLKAGEDGSLVPDGKLDEPYIVRPTSETIIGAVFAKWVESHRDLPLKINQWANVVRWERRPRIFLRTTEFLWQEGHTVHATSEEAIEHTYRMLDVYADFAEGCMAMPVIKGEKTESERFPGAVMTTCIEAMMQDRKALQAGTSHFLGQNFSRNFGIQFQAESGELEFGWTTSWGVSTRLIGGLIMTHADDDGLVLPPRLAPAQVVIIPITMKADDPQAVIDHCERLADELRGTTYGGRPLRVRVDARGMRGGDKVWSWIKKGVPIRLEVGPRDIAEDSVFMGRRDRAPKEKSSVKRAEFIASVAGLLDEMQRAMLDRALTERRDNTKAIDTREDFLAYFESGGGFAECHWSGSADIERQVKDDLGVTIRCIPLGAGEPGTCPFSGDPSPKRVIWARSY